MCASPSNLAQLTPLVHCFSFKKSVYTNDKEDEPVINFSTELWLYRGTYPLPFILIRLHLVLLCCMTQPPTVHSNFHTCLPKQQESTGQGEKQQRNKRVKSVGSEGAKLWQRQEGLYQDPGPDGSGRLRRGAEPGGVDGHTKADV